MSTTAILALVIVFSGSGSNRELFSDPVPAQPLLPHGDFCSSQVSIPHSSPDNRTAGPAQGLSANGVVELRSILDANKLADLRWADFSNFKGCVAEVYADTGYGLVWLEHSRPTPEALRVVHALENAEEKGLVPSDYDGPRWAGRLEQLERSSPPPESTLVHFDVALTVSTMRYLYDLRFGRLNPRTFHTAFDVKRNEYDLARFLLNRIAHDGDIRPTLAEIEPPYPAYHRTLRALAVYRKLAREYKGKPLPVPKRSVKPGESYVALPQLAELLRLLGDLPSGARIPEGNIYEGAVVEAVKHFQTRHGLEPDGRIGRDTFQALNTPLSQRVVQLELTLERWRWLPHRFDQPPIIVNIPEFRLHAINSEHHQVLAMKVVLGKAYGHKTPVFATQMDSVIFRPYWNVPYSIQRKEIVPDLRKNMGYLLKHNYQVVDDRQQVVSQGAVNASLLDEIRQGTVHVRQRPGPKNALGLIKFDMPNRYNVYMHDTPVTSLFAKSRRDFSHGCIRVEKPLALAVWVLRNNEGWTEERIREAMNGDKTFRERLVRPIPVLIVYGTALVNENGETYFFADIYGLDADLEKALAAGRPYPRPWGYAEKGEDR
jgi:murein L,D-transpeptidase YcbB/YkuD